MRVLEQEEETKGAICSELEIFLVKILYGKIFSNIVFWSLLRDEEKCWKAFWSFCTIYDITITKNWNQESINGFEANRKITIVYEFKNVSG